MAALFLSSQAAAVPPTSYTGKGAVWYWIGDSTGANFVSKNAPGTRAGIQAACDSARTNKRVEIQLGPGTYDLDSTLWVHGNTRIRGAGRGVTILKRSRFSASDPTNTGHVVISAKFGQHSANSTVTGGLPADSLENITIEGLTIDGNYGEWPTADPNTPGNFGIQFWFVDGAVIRDVEVKNTLQTGIELDACRNSLIDGCYTRNTGQQINLGTRNGININNNSGSLNASVNWARRIKVLNSFILNHKDAALDCANVSEVTIENLHTWSDHDTTYGNMVFEFEGSLTGYTMHDFHINNVTARGENNQFFQNGITNANLERVSVTNCSFVQGNSTVDSTRARWAILARNANAIRTRDILFENCMFDSLNAGGAGPAGGVGRMFYMAGDAGDSASGNFTFRNLTFRGVNQSENNTSNIGFDIAGNVHNVLLDNVRIFGAEREGIYIHQDTNAAGALRDVTLQNCYVDGANSYGLRIGGSGFAKEISGVKVINCTFKDVSISSGSGAQAAIYIAGSTNLETVHNITLQGNRLIRTATAGSNMLGLRLHQSGTGVLDSLIIEDNDLSCATSSKLVVTASPTNVLYRDAGLVPIAQASLPSFMNGSSVYCSDCQQTNPCASGGSGAFARREVGAWNCGGSGGGGGGGSGDSLDNNIWIYWKDSGGTYRPAIKVDSTNVLRFQTMPSGTSTIDFYTTAGALGARFYGTDGSFNAVTGDYMMGGYAVLKRSGNDFRIMHKSGSGNVAFRDSANTADVWTIDNTGNVRLYGTETLFDAGTVASANSMALSIGNVFRITVGLNVNTITPKIAGTIIYIRVTGACTLTDGIGNLKLNGNFVGDNAGDEDTIILESDGTNWYELGRSIN